jgi:acyl carrier protein
MEPSQAVARAVIAALGRVDARLSEAALRPELSLVDDLGLDSVRFIELTLEIEQALGLDELPLQRWSDLEAARAGERYTIRSLIAFCAECLRSAS